MLLKAVKSVLSQRRFRAAFDLLLLRSESSEELKSTVSFWEEQQQLFPMWLAVCRRLRFHSASDGPPEKAQPMTLTVIALGLISTIHLSN